MSIAEDPKPELLPKPPEELISLKPFVSNLDIVLGIKLLLSDLSFSICGKC